MVERGQRVALVGPSGSGKTLLLRALAMLDPLDAGEVRWRGRMVPDREIPSFRSHVIYLHQRPVLAEGTVEDNLKQPFSLRTHRGRRFDRRKVVSLLESLGRNESFLSKKQSDLSGGEAQLTALLRAIQLDAELLLLDEPTSALDAEATRTVEQLVAAWLEREQGRRAFLWVSHDFDQARRVSDVVRQIRTGRLEGNEDGRVC